MEEEKKIPETKMKVEAPFHYGPDLVEEVNLDGLLELTGRDMCMLDAKMMQRGYTGTRMEVTRQYAMLVAAHINQKPDDWLDGMKARDSIKLREIVATFFFVRG